MKNMNTMKFTGTVLKNLFSKPAQGLILSSRENILTGQGATWKSI